MIQSILIFPSLRVKQEKNKLNQLRTTLKQQSSVFQRQTTELENIILASYKQWRSYLLANVAKTKGGRLVGAAKCDDFFVLSEQEQVWRIDWCL